MTISKIFKQCLLLIAFAAAPFSYLSAQDSGEGELAIAITGLRNTEGNMIVTYFNDIESYYEKDKDFFRCDTVSLADLDKKSKAKIIRTTLPAGKYVIFAFHDADKNGKMAKSLLGSFLEGAGYANNKGAAFRRPQFKDSAVLITDGCNAVASIRLLYSEPTF